MAAETAMKFPELYKELVKVGLGGMDGEEWGWMGRSGDGLGGVGMDGEEWGWMGRSGDGIEGVEKGGGCSGGG